MVFFVLIILSAVKVNKVTYAQFKTWLAAHKNLKRAIVHILTTKVLSI